MRLPTLSQHRLQVDQMSSLYNQVARLQQQTASQKTLLADSDDPLLASQIKVSRDYIDQLQSYQLNMTLAENRTNLVNINMQQSVDLLKSAQELVIHARNSSLNDGDRQLIANQLDSVLSSLLAIGNQQDANGDYIYSGYLASQPAFTADYQYQGSYDGMSLLIDDQLTIPYNESGQCIFGDMFSGNGCYAVKSDANNTGSGVLALPDVTAAGAQDSYTIQFVTNAANQLAYQVVGVVSGQLLPAPPLTSPADAPAFVSGQSFEFNGVTTQVSGMPNVGDTFSVGPSQKQSVFTTLQNISALLKMPSNSPTLKATIEQGMQQESASLNQAMDHLLLQLTDAGGRAKLIDDRKHSQADLLLQEKVALSRLSDVDLAQSITDLTQQLSALDMAQQTYAKIQESLSRILFGR